MTGFQAWHLPSPFSLRKGEVAGLEEFESKVARYASLSEPRMGELMRLLRDGWEHGLASFPVERVLGAVDRVAGRLMERGDPLRDGVLHGLGAFSGLSSNMAEAVLNGMAEGWREESLREMLHSEFRDPGALDGFVPGIRDQTERALGFPLTFHLGAGTVPGVSTTSLVRALLVKSAVLLRPGSGDLGFPVYFARGLEEEDPELAHSVAVLYWPVAESGRTEAVLREADLVVVYGSNETVRWVREHLPPQTELRAYRHRMGFALVGRGALGRGLATARDAARSVALFDQRGCVSPHVFFVEEGGELAPKEWAAQVARALEELERELPSGQVSLEEGVSIQQLRGTLEIAEGLGEGEVHHGGDAAPWTVAFLPSGVVEPSCLNRNIRVIPVETLDHAIQALKPWAPYLQTVGVAGLSVVAPRIMEDLARLGVSRIVGLPEMPWPVSWWHHDGSGPLQDLVRWTDAGIGWPVKSDNDGV
jgi:hypothetical protein